MSTQNVASPPVTPSNGAPPVPNGAPAAPVAVAVPVSQPVAQQPVPQPPVPVAAAPIAAAAGQPSIAQPAVAVAVPVPVAQVAKPVVAAPVASAPAQPVAAPAAIAAAVASPVAAAPSPAVQAAPQATAQTAPGSPPATPVAPKPAPAKSPKQVVTLAPRLGQQRTDWKALSTVIFISAGLHVLAMLACTLIVFNNPQIMEQIFTEVTEEKEIADEPIVDTSMDQPNEIKETSDDTVTNPSASEMVFEKGPIDININDQPVAQVDVKGDIPGLADINFANAAGGRMSSAARAALVKSDGGSTASEAAVAHGMRWLKNHQFSDGGWSFDHDSHPDCKGKCTQAGTLKEGGRMAATGLALLAFLGGGHTHQNGDYQKEVKHGVEFLLKNGRSTPTGFDLCPITTANEKMYTQGLCTIARAELAALTKDNRIKQAATASVAFIVAAQNPKSGGWRYTPATPDPGDTSVVGWQIMALKSAKNAKLPVPAGTFKGAELYLNAAQVQGGSQYVYDLSAKTGTPTMTAAGLLCRMYLGWDRKSKGLQEGVKYLASVKPAPNNMYYNYYATQVMHHWGGDEWTAWNNIMRDQLVRTQKTGKDGHMQGSWDLADPHGAVGGRLYMSCLCIMTLEVYYRHLPIYRREGLKVDF